MKLLLLNATANTGSTGRIAEEIGMLAQQTGFVVKMAYGRNAVNSRLPLLKIGNKWDIRSHGLESRLFDNHGFASRKATQKFIEEIEEWKPDIIQIHNLHGYYINVEILFNYLKKIQMPVVWTFHDCWPFTGHCSYFDRVNCHKWETQCRQCPNKKGYPESWFIDRSKTNFIRKKNIFNGIKSLTIVTPSAWLAQHVKRSFLRDYPVRVINNGIDLKLFNPGTSEMVLNKYNIIENKFILGVANVWDARKGLNDFIALRQKLPTEIPIVLVGLSMKQSTRLPAGIIAIPRTENIQELAALYTAASVFVNPTYVDNFPTTNIEALACGTPIVTYNTGGSPEAVDAETGTVVEKGNLEGLKIAIEILLLADKSKISILCRQRATQYFNQQDRYNDYITLYRKMMGINP